MKTSFRLFRCALLLALSPALALASGDFLSKILPPLPPKDQNQVAGIIYVYDVDGQVEAVNPETGRISDLKKGDVLPGRGARIYSHDNATATLLFSNQTSVFVTKNTSLRVEKFDQEPFQPNNNLLIEPSNSQLIVYVQDGQIVVSTPQLLSGSRLMFESQHCAASILNNQSGGQKAFLITDDKATHFGMILGEARVNVRDKDGKLAFLGRLIKTNEEAFVRPTLGSEDDKKNGLAVNEGITSSVTSNLASSKAGRGDHKAVPLGQFYVVDASDGSEYIVNGKAEPLTQGAAVVANGTDVIPPIRAT